jgi:hypothetical protein
MLSALVLFPYTARAGLIAYGIDYTVEYITPQSIGAVGNHYFGFFAVDDAILATDGLNQPGVVFGFVTKIESNIWSSNFPNPVSDFSGFRGPGGLGAASPGFDVVLGEIVNMRGGVFGGGDFPFIDFSSNNGPGAPDYFPPTDGCTGSYCGNQANQFWTLGGSPGVENSGFAFGGSMLIHRVPEPSTVFLLALGLVGLAVSRTCRAQS